MSSTPDWMRGGDSPEQPVRAGLPLSGIVIWTLSLAIIANVAMAILHLMG